MSLFGAAGSLSSPVTVSVYSAKIHALRLRLDHSGSAQGAQAIGVQLGRLGAVRLPDGRIVHPDNASVAGLLGQATRADLPSLRRRLDALDNTLRAQPRFPANTTGLRSLDSILAQPVFHPLQNPLDRLLGLLGDLILNVLAAIAQFLSGLTGRAPGLGLPLLILAPVFLVVLAVLAVLLARAIVRRAVADIPATDMSGEPATFSSAESRAESEAARGDYRAALRYLVLATILDLQERGLLDLRPGLTNREYLRDLRRQAEQLRSPLAELVDAFDRVWYGHQEVSAEEYARYEALAREARAAARQSVA